jgi:hypothetical protein
MILFIMAFYPVDILVAQTINSKVLDLYYQSVAFPEDFESSYELMEASGLLKKEMISCLVPLKEKYFKLASAAIEQCKKAHAGNPNAEFECLKHDPSASLAYWADGMIQVINDKKEWVNTFTGSNMLMAKTLSERIQPGIWVEGIKMGMPIIKQKITCP